MTVGAMVVAVVGVISFFKKRLSVTEMECLGVSFGLVENDLQLGVVIVVVVVVVEMEVDELKWEVGIAVRLVWGCLNGRPYFLWCLS